MNNKTTAIFLLSAVSFLVSTVTPRVTGASLPDFVQGMLLGMSVTGFVYVLVQFGMSLKRKGKSY